MSEKTKQGAVELRRYMPVVVYEGPEHPDFAHGKMQGRPDGRYMLDDDVLTALRDKDAELADLTRRLDEEEQSCLQVIGERDDFEERTTALSEAVGEYFRVDVGEWSNDNDMDRTALEVLGGGYKTDSDADRRAERAEAALDAKDAQWISVDTPPVEGQAVMCHGYNYDDPEKGLWMTPEFALFTFGEFHAKDHDPDEDRWSEFAYVARFWQPLPAPPSVPAKE